MLGADGRAITVTGEASQEERVAVAYNLEIDGIHTYHVGRAEVLVHNHCSKALGSALELRVS